MIKEERVNFFEEISSKIARLKPKIEGLHPESPLIINKITSEKKLKIPRPGFCCLGVVDSCMLKCAMCEKWKDDIKVKDKNSVPTTDQWKRFLVQLREITDGPFEVDFGGGEALMKEDLFELIKFASDLGFTTTIASNGFLINEALAKKISQSGLTKVILSLDSLDPDLHDSMRGVKGVHKRVINAIEYLDKQRHKDFIIGICSIIMGKTLSGIIDLYNWVHNDDRIKHILFMAVMQPNNTSLDLPWYKKFTDLWPQDKVEINNIIDQLIEFRKKSYKISNPDYQLEAFRSYFNDPVNFVKKGRCNLDKAVHVSAVGDIFLCFKWDILGNIKNDFDIREIWYSNEAEQTRKKIGECQDNCHYLLNCFFEKDDMPF